MRPRSLRLAVAGAVAAVAVAAGVAGHVLEWLPSLEQDTVHTRFSLRGPSPPRGIAVVAIDPATFARYDDRSWPYPRSMHAAAIDRLRRAGARVIVYDIQFTEATRPREDVALFDAVRRAGNVVLATSEIDDGGRTNVLGGGANLVAARARVGAANVETGAGGVVERMPYSVGGLRSLAVVAAEKAGGRAIPARDFPEQGALIDYAGAPGTVPTISFADLLAGTFDRDLVRGRIVVVGASAPTLHDLSPTPASDGRMMSGPEIQANAITTAQRGLPLRDAPAWMQLLLIALLGVAPSLLAVRARVLVVVVAAVVAFASLIVAAQLAFNAGVLLDVTWSVLPLAIAVVATTAAGYVEANAHRRVVLRVNEVLEQRVDERTAELRESQLEVVRRLALAAEQKDTDTGAHVERIGIMCGRLALAAGLPAEHAERIGRAAILHDVGKIAVPDAVLQKPGRFTSEERAVMQRHARAGAEMLAGSPSPLLQEAETIARTHHERWDGMGYPAGLAGEAIPVAGRICAVCDVFDALVSKRVYKDAMSLGEALGILAADRGSHFDPDLVDRFLPLAPGLYAEFHGADAESTLDWTLRFADSRASVRV